MPWFLNPFIYNDLPISQNPELYLFLAKIAAAAVFAVYARKSGMKGLRLAANTFIFLFGVFLTVMLSMHCLVITGLRVFGGMPATGPQYDFHTYSLILMGAVLIVQGIRLIRSAVDIKNGHDDGTALRTILIVLAVAVPLIPLQFFGMMITALSILGLASVAVLRYIPQNTGFCDDEISGAGGNPASVLS